MLDTALTTTALSAVAPKKQRGPETRERESRESNTAEPNRFGPNTDEDVVALSRQLRLHGIEPKIRVFPWGASAGGIALRIRVRELIAAPDQLNDWRCDIRRILESGVRLTLSLDDLGLDDKSIDCLQQFCLQVQEALPDGGLPKQQLGLCVAASDIALPGFQVISSALLGRGPRYVAVNRAYMDTGTTSRDISADWRALFNPRVGLVPLWPVYAAGIRTRCPLLNNEATDALLPGAGIAVPAGTAWLPMELDISRFADATGILHREALAQALDACVELGDRLFSLLSWPEERQQADARLNRRLAVMLTGLGDLVLMRKQDPADLDCLRELDRMVAYIHDTLWQKSKQLAEDCGPLPALDQQNPAGRWSDESHNQDWRRRWQQAMCSAQVRHRNLLVMSPYSVLPRYGPAHRDYVDLLPLIAHADALSFASPPPCPGWTANAFMTFHRRAWAVTQRRNAASFIAAGV